jgi:splicing factor 3B subunit 1
MTPPIKDLLPRLTPILRNRHEKVQENCIDLVGRIADRGAEFVSAKEWMRICFELLDMLKVFVCVCVCRGGRRGKEQERREGG